MRKIILIILGLNLLFCPAYAKKKAATVPLTASIQEVKAATLDDEDSVQPKKKSKKMHKKHKKAKKQ